MKKLIAIIVTVCMCVCFCAPLAACDFGNGFNTGPHMCYFTQAVADSRYLASEATCTTGALYYYSCSCGGKGTTTFEYGYPLNHSFTNYVSNNNATHDTDGTKTATCDRAGCNATDTITDHGTKGHSYSKEWYYDENNHWHICPICYDKTNNVAHTYSNGVCSICGSTNLTSTITIWYVGGQEEAKRCKDLKDAFETEYPDIELKFTNGGGYDAILNSLSFGQNVADLIYVDDEYFKRMVDGGFIVGLDSYLADSTIDVDNMWKEAVGRYRYNKNYNTSNASDPLYAIPKDVNPTTMFVNVGAMRNAGITVISVDEADIPAFYAGTKADNYGNTIDDYINGKGTDIKANEALNDVKGEHSGSLLNIVKKGYYEAGDNIKVFNVRVACNWDEIEACAKVMTTNHNAKSPTTYGYQTEWWFYYGWTVGGDCIGDQNGRGQFVFTLDDPNPNYKVIADVTINGTEYKASGDVNMTFVSYKDKLYLASNSSEVTSLVSAGKLQEFPSTKEAFTRFCMLSRSGTDADGNTGVSVAPMPNSGTTTYTDALNQFNLGNKLAMFVGYADAAYSISTNVDWDFAAMPIYKSYDATDNSVEKIGTAASQSKSTAYAMTTKCVERGKKDNAMKVLEFFCGDEGQEILAKGAYAIPNSATAANTYYLPEAKKAFGNKKNIQTIIDASETQLPGDWWYMQERAWIANWSQSLNANNDSVRNNGMTLSRYFSSVKTLTNNALKRLWKTQAN